MIRNCKRSIKEHRKKINPQIPLLSSTDVHKKKTEKKISLATQTVFRGCEKTRRLRDLLFSLCYFALCAGAQENFGSYSPL